MSTGLFVMAWVLGVVWFVVTVIASGIGYATFKDEKGRYDRASEWNKDSRLEDAKRAQLVLRLSLLAVALSPFAIILVPLGVACGLLYGLYRLLFDAIHPIGD